MTEIGMKAIRKATMISDAVRKAYYRRLLGVKELDIHFPVFIQRPEFVRLGERVSINAFVHIWANAEVSIGDDSLIASHVQITSSTHDYKRAVTQGFRIDKPVTIGKNVWIGSGAIIFPGVTIGDNSVIGAASLVNHDIPPDSVAFGAPARVMKVVERSAGDEASIQRTSPPSAGGRNPMRAGMVRGRKEPGRRGAPA